MPYSNSVPAPTLHNPAGLGMGEPPAGPHGASGSGSGGRRPLPRPPGDSNSYSAGPSSGAGAGGSAGDELPIYSGDGSGYRDEKKRLPSAPHGGYDYVRERAPTPSSAGLGVGVGAEGQGQGQARSRVSSGLRPLPILPPTSPTPPSGSDSAPSTATHATHQYADPTPSRSTSQTGHTAETHGYTSTYETGHTSGTGLTGGTGATRSTGETVWTPATSVSHGSYGMNTSSGDVAAGSKGYGSGMQAVPTISSPEDYSTGDARTHNGDYLNSFGRTPAYGGTNDGLSAAPGGYGEYDPSGQVRTPRPTDHLSTPSSAVDTSSSELMHPRMQTPTPSDSQTSSSSHLNTDGLRAPLSAIERDMDPSPDSSLNAFPTARPHLPVHMSLNVHEDYASMRSFHTASENGPSRGGSSVHLPYDLPPQNTSSGLAQAQAGSSAGPGTHVHAHAHAHAQHVPLPEPAPRHPNDPHTSTAAAGAGAPRESVASDLSSSWNNQPHPPSHWVQAKLQIHQGQDEEEIEDEWDEQEVEGIHFFQPALLSEAAVQLRDRVERGRHLKGGIAWPGSFTGKDLVMQAEMEMWLEPAGAGKSSGRVERGETAKIEWVQDEEGQQRWKRKEEPRQNKGKKARKQGKKGAKE